MEGQKKRIEELDPDELLNRLLSEEKLVAKGANVLHKNDIDGAVFVEMKDNEFSEIGGLSFGIRKSLIMFRNKILAEEKEFLDIPILDAGPGSISEALNERRQPKDIVEKFAASVEFEKKDDVESTLGRTYLEEDEELDPDSTDLFSPPLPHYSPSMNSEGDGEDSFCAPIYDKPKETPGENEELDCSDCKPKVSEELIKGVPQTRVEYKEEARPSRKSLQLCSESLVGQHKLQKFVFNGEVKWEEQGKQRCSKDFMKLRSDEIVLEGFLQKLAGSNSKFKMNHWTSRYALLLKSGVLLNFACHNKKLYYKGVADLNKTERIQIPLTKSGACSLRLEIHTSEKRVVVGFSTEAEMLIWRDEVLGFTKDGLKEEDEKSN